MSGDPTGLLSGAFGLAGTLINLDAQESANKTNLQIARENRDFYYQQWLRENAYNSPSAQMQRLSAAGLNPSLMYGEGAGGLPASASMANVETGRVVAPQLDPLLMAQIANLNAQTKATADANTRENEKQGLTLESMRQSLANMVTENDKMKSEVRYMDAQAEDIYVQWTFKDLQLSIDQQTADKQSELWNSEIAKNDEELKLTQEQCRQLTALFTLQKQGIELTNDEIRSRIGVNRAEAIRLKKCLDVMGSQMSESKANTLYTLKKREFVKTTSEASADLAKKQAAYYEDYKLHPERYRPKVHSESTSHEFGTSQARGGSSKTVYDSN